MNETQTKLSINIPLLYVYKGLRSFILDHSIWMLFLLFKGFTLAEIALIETAFHCMIFLFEVPTGYIADRFGKRVSLILAEAIGIVSAGLLVWGDHWAVIIIGFMLGGLAGTFRSGSASAMIYESLRLLGKEGTFKRYNSHLSAIMLIVLGVSGAAGGVLSDIDWISFPIHLLVWGVIVFYVVVDLVLQPGPLSSHWAQQQDHRDAGRN